MSILNIRYSFELNQCNIRLGKILEYLCFLFYLCILSLDKNSLEIKSNFQVIILKKKSQLKYKEHFVILKAVLCQKESVLFLSVNIPYFLLFKCQISLGKVTDFLKNKLHFCASQIIIIVKTKIYNRYVRREP